MDVGCGDFSVASGFVDQLDEYVGIDVVDSLIRRNSADFGRPGIRFLKANAAREELPKADVCLIRQVLQHLSMTKCQQSSEELRTSGGSLSRSTSRHPVGALDRIVTNPMVQTRGSIPGLG